MVNIRSGLNRYLNCPPHNRNINIMQDRPFQTSNEVFNAVLKEIRRKGMDKTCHEPPIGKGDLEKMYQTETLSTRDPTALQSKVFFLYFLAFCKEGTRWSPRINQESFQVKEVKKARQK